MLVAAVLMSVNLENLYIFYLENFSRKLAATKCSHGKYGLSNYRQRIDSENLSQCAAILAIQKEREARAFVLGILSHILRLLGRSVRSC